MALQSMTGFASVSGQTDGVEWAWEARSVNARGLDLRARLPEGLEGLEARARTEGAKQLKRGTVNYSLKMQRPEGNGLAQLNPDALAVMIEATKAARDMAQANGLELAPPSACDILNLRGVLDHGRRAENSKALEDAVNAGLIDLFSALKSSRAQEGEALSGILTTQIDQIKALLAAARETDTARSARSGTLLQARVQALLEDTKIVDEARLAQELATLAVKADITEEIDRLEAHIASAYALLDEDGPVGRKLDFLMQEFNREANTLCSKSGDAALTAVGLELKVTIDQMREQVQNVE